MYTIKEDSWVVQFIRKHHNWRYLRYRDQTDICDIRRQFLWALFKGLLKLAAFSAVPIFLIAVFLEVYAYVKWGSYFFNEYTGFFVIEILPVLLGAAVASVALAALMYLEIDTKYGPIGNFVRLVRLLFKKTADVGHSTTQVGVFVMVSDWFKQLKDKVCYQVVVERRSNRYEEGD